VAVGRIVALRALGLGDALTGVPALRGLRRRYPEAELVLAAPAAPGELLRQLGVVDSVLVTRGLSPIAAEPGALAVNLHGRGPESHRLLEATRPARILAFRDAGTGTDGPEWRADEHEVERWCRLVRSDGGSCRPEDLLLAAAGLPASAHPGAVVVHPGAASGSRRWPAKRWMAVVEQLLGAGLPVVVTGGRDEAELCAEVARPGAVNLADALDLPELAATVAAASLVLCGDTGVAHVATAFAVRSVLLFGPVSPALWGPAVDRDRHRVLWHGPHAGDPHGWAVDPALARITVTEVLSAVAGLLPDGDRLGGLDLG
jgi:ADP-heptose:LPS heptosyltransferase